MPRQDIRSGYAYTDDGVQIHWRVLGSGIPLVCSNGVGVGTFFWKYIAEKYQHEYSVVLWDYRGHGLSARTIDPYNVDLSIQRHAMDLNCVLNAAFQDNPEEIILMGHSMGCQVSLEAYQILGPRVKCLVLLLGTAGRSLETFANSSWSPYVFRGIRKLAFRIGPRINHITRPLLLSPLAWPFSTTLALVDPLYTRREDFQPYVDHLATMDLVLFFEAVWQCHLHDAWDALSGIQCPTMVVAAENDTFTPIHCAQDVADRIPDSALFVLADASHAALIEQPETINYQLDRFFSERVWRESRK